MSDPSRFSSPSRKSRFGRQERGRPASQASGPETVEEVRAGDALAADTTNAAPETIAGAPVKEEPSLAAPPDEAPGKEVLPAGLRLTRSPDLVTPSRGTSAAKLALVALLALSAGGGLGYFTGHSSAAAAPAAGRAEPAHSAPPLTLSADLQAAVEAAFNDVKQAHYADARRKFEALYAQHPEWPSMEIEAARASLYQRDMKSTHALLATATRERPLVDAGLIAALLHLTAQEYTLADDAFATAAATDPARSDVYYFWGENLRREGKPQQAATRFKSALVRNQYENVEPLYLLKYWLSLVQSDQDAASGEGAKIDASLASAHPSSAALFAGAARAIKAGNYKDAADLLGRARTVTDPTVFNVVLRDPMLTEVNLRPEIAPFYK